MLADLHTVVLSIFMDAHKNVMLLSIYYLSSLVSK